MRSLVVTEQLYRKISGDVNACAVSVCQALFPLMKESLDFEHRSYRLCNRDWEQLHVSHKLNTSQGGFTARILAKFNTNFVTFYTIGSV